MRSARCGEIAVAGVGERLLRGEGDVTLGMGAGQVPILGSVGDAQIAATKDGGLRQDLLVPQGGGQKKRLEDRAWRSSLAFGLGWFYCGQQRPVFTSSTTPTAGVVRSAEERAAWVVVSAGAVRGRQEAAGSRAVRFGTVAPSFWRVRSGGKTTAPSSATLPSAAPPRSVMLGTLSQTSSAFVSPRGTSESSPGRYVLGTFDKSASPRGRLKAACEHSAVSFPGSPIR